MGPFTYNEFLGGVGLAQAVTASRDTGCVQMIVKIDGRRKPAGEDQVYNLLRRLELDGEHLTLRLTDPEKSLESPQERFLVVRVFSAPGKFDVSRLFSGFQLPEGTSLGQVLRALDEHLVRAAFDECDGNRAHAAARLGVSATTFSERARSYGLPASPPGNFSRSKKRPPLKS